MSLINHIDLNASKASKEQLFWAASNLKARAVRTLNTFEKRGIETKESKLLKARISSNPELFSGKMSMNMSRQDIQKLYTTYRDFSATFYNDEWKINKSSTLSGYNQVREETAKRLGFADYANWTEEQRGNLWEIIEKIKNMKDSNYWNLGSEHAQQLITNEVVKNGNSDINSINDIMGEIFTGERDYKGNKIETENEEDNDDDLPFYE